MPYTVFSTLQRRKGRYLSILSSNLNVLCLFRMPLIYFLKLAPDNYGEIYGIPRSVEQEVELFHARFHTYPLCILYNGANRDSSRRFHHGFYDYRRSASTGKRVIPFHNTRIHRDPKYTFCPAVSLAFQNQSVKPEIIRS
jgi:hypothetical protein